jgi:competence ComEA-like helix-hairpin-helix protein
MLRYDFLSCRLRRPRRNCNWRRLLTLDVNRANQRDFERLPGIGPVLARRIVEYRESRGAFQDIEQLRGVKGIGKKTFEGIRAFVAVLPTGVTRPARKTA